MLAAVSVASSFWCDHLAGAGQSSWPLTPSFPQLNGARKRDEVRPAAYQGFGSPSSSRPSPWWHSVSAPGTAVHGRGSRHGGQDCRLLRTPILWACLPFVMFQVLRNR